MVDWTLDKPIPTQVIRLLQLTRYTRFNDFSTNEGSFTAFVAIDWSDKKHDFCLQAAGSQEREFGTFLHHVRLIDEWAHALHRRFGGTIAIAIALELAKGTVVYALQKYDYFIQFPINPSTLAKYREAFKPSGAKDDPTNAELALDLVLRHSQRFKPMRPQSVAMRLLGHLVEQRRDLVDDKKRIVNRLCNTLKQYYPQALDWCDHRDTIVFCDFIARWPTLTHVKRARNATLETFFKAHNTARHNDALGMQHINEPIPRLPAALAHLQSLIDSLMAKDPSSRSQTGAETVKRIDALQADATPMLTQELNRVQPASKSRLRWLIAAAAVLAISAVAIWSPWRARQSAGAAPADPAAAKSPDSAFAKSIAVLPFENLSTDKENAYFASGMRDIILTKLSAIGNLKVISRTSTEKYASHPDDLKTIALQLGVATILEGSVQKSGNQVLINAQLIDSRTDNHLRAEAYPRTLDNIFGVEGEVAQSVADAHKAKLTPGETAVVTTVSTHNREAYDLYLRANVHFNRANDQFLLSRLLRKFSESRQS